MMGLLLMGLLGVVVVCIGAPLILLALCMETLRERAAAAPSPARPAPSESPRRHPARVVTLSHAAA